MDHVFALASEEGDRGRHELLDFGVGTGVSSAIVLARPLKFPLALLAGDHVGITHLGEPEGFAKCGVEVLSGISRVYDIIGHASLTLASLIMSSALVPYQWKGTKSYLHFPPQAATQSCTDPSVSPLESTE